LPNFCEVFEWTISYRYDQKNTTNDDDEEEEEDDDEDEEENEDRTPAVLGDVGCW